MRYASSAISTCSAWASILEWTATVRMARRRHVRMTRQAISPRFAIRILENMASGNRRCVFREDRLRGRRDPGRLALLEECADAFTAFGRRTDAGDAFGRVLDELARHRPVRDRADQVLGFALRGGARFEQQVHQRAD